MVRKKYYATWIQKISEELLYLVENKNLVDILGKSAKDFVDRGDIPRIALMRHAGVSHPTDKNI
jgi:hypothetical protein